MMDVPLTIGSIMRYGTSIFGDREVVTWTGEGTRRRSYAEAGRRAAQLANALWRLGVDGDQRVGTFMWNNAEHLEAYLAVPSMGAVLHTLNIRLATAEVGYIATHAADHTVIVDASLVPRFAEILPHAQSVKNVIVSGAPLTETPGADELTGVSVYDYEELLAAEADSHPWPVLDELSAGVLAHMRAEGGDLSSLRLVIAGGSAVPHAMQVRYEAELGVRMLQAWGMTETSPLASVANPPPGVSEEEAWYYRDSQGRLFCAVEARLAGDGGEILPSDGEAVGEIEVRGPWIAGSYYKDGGPAKFHDGWLRTGGVGTLDERGFSRLTDRAKDVIKSGGEWISSMELENVLMAHPDVAEAAVIGVADDKWGERPLAAVVLRSGAEVTAEKLRAFMTEQIPRWQLPERWCFVAEVPKTSVGKFSKRQMRDAYQRGDYEIIEVH